MKVIFSHASLQEGVNKVSKAVPSKTTMPILQYIMIDARMNEIRLTANDTELGIETVVEGQILQRGKIAIDARIFSDIIRRLPNSDITLETDDNLVAHISCEKANFQIPGLEGDDYPFLPMIEKGESLALSQFSLKEIIRQTIFSIAVNENNKLMTGELFEVKEGRLKVVSLDGHRIAIRNLELDQCMCPDKKVVVPGKTLSEISKILSGEMEELVFLYFEQDCLFFEFGSTRVMSRLIEGEYFHIDQMLSSDYETRIKINRMDLQSCIDRASLLVREGDKMPVVFDMEDGVLNMEMRSNIGSMDESIEIEKTGKDMKIGFNPKFILDALRVIDEESVDLYFVNPKAPCFIKDDEGRYVYLILPVNI